MLVGERVALLGETPAALTVAVTVAVMVAVMVGVTVAL